MSKISKPACVIPSTEVNEAICKRVLAVVDKGLVGGIGEPVPGEMCVEAAVAYAYGERHTDKPKCVNSTLSDFKISLNDDLNWENDDQRAKGLRRLAIAQLGTKGSGFKFSTFKRLLQEKLEAVIFEYGVKPYLNGLTKALASKKKLDVILGEIASLEDMNTDDLGFSIYGPESMVDALENSQNISDDKKILLCEIVVQVLVQMNTPGSRYLYLTKAPKLKTKF